MATKKVSINVKSVKNDLYLVEVFKGLMLTLKHFLKIGTRAAYQAPLERRAGEVSTNKRATIQYPEEKWVPYENYRGLHRLNKDEQDRTKCVACEMCATACPADCITIEAERSPWADEYPNDPKKEKHPKKYEIDILRCIFCGFCEEACPCEAIELTEIYDFAAYSRENAIYDKEKLEKVFELTKDGKYYQEGRSLDLEF